MGNMSLVDILSVIWRRKVFAIVGGLTGVLLVVLFTSTLTPKYVSNSSLLVDLRRLEVAKNGLIPNVPPSVLETLVNSERSLLTSNSVMLKVVDKNDLQMDPEFGGATGMGLLINAFKSSIGLDGSSGSDRRLAAAAELRKALTVVRKKDTVVLTVALSTSDPAKSQKLNRSLLETYREVREETARASVDRVVETLEGQLNGQAQAVAQAEEAVESYKIRNNIVDANGQLNSDQQIATITNQLNAAQLDTNRAQSRFEQVRDLIRIGKVEAAGSDLFQSQLIADLRTRLLQAKDQRSVLQATLQSGHPSMVEINTRITSLKNALQLEAQDVLKVIEQDLKRARKVEANLKQELVQLQTQTGSLKKSLVPLRELERKAEAARSVYVATLTRIREIRAQQGVDDSNVRVISEASLPLQNERISRKLLAMLGAAFGGTIGAFVGFFTAFSAGGRIRKAEQLEAMTGLPVLGRVPSVDANAQSKGSLFGRKSSGAILDLSGVDENGQSSGGLLSGVYPHLRGAFEGVGQEQSEPEIVLVLALEAESSSSAYAANFAAMAHGDGDYVLYGDGVVHQSDILSSYLMLNETPHEETGSRRKARSGMLGSLLEAGRDGSSTQLDSLDKIDYLSLSQAGKGRRSELQALALSLDEHIDDYDFVVFDGGNLFEQPALSVLSYFADHILLIVQEKQTDFDALDRAYQLLGEARDKVVGCLYVDGKTKRSRKQRNLESSDLPLVPVAWDKAKSSDHPSMRQGKSVKRSFG